MIDTLLRSYTKEVLYMLVILFLIKLKRFPSGFIWVWFWSSGLFW